MDMMEPFAFPYWASAVLASIQKEQKLDAKSHDFTEYLERHVESLALTQGYLLDGDPMIRLAAVYMDDHLRSQSSRWLCENASLVNAMACRLLIKNDNKMAE